jgi:3-phosphoglycerate kinase/fructose/tagatose bisphosphate aldolase
MVDSRLSSIHELYMAMARGEAGGFTVPAFNLRGMTEELAQGIFEAAKETGTGAFILEIARSEMGYTAQSPAEFVRRVLAGADAASWTGPIFVQGDHTQAKAEEPGRIAEGDMENIQKLIDEEIEAGFFNIDIDASTLVDISLPAVVDQQRVNATVTASLARYIRMKQSRGMTISIGGEIGHIGDRNSTEEDLTQFMQLFQSIYPKEMQGLSKVSVQTGTSHGGHMMKDGTLESMSVDFGVIESLSRLAKTMGMAGVVQHGASTLRESMFIEFPKHGANEIHLSTGWQNMIYDHPNFPKELKKEIYEWLDSEKSSERKEGETDDQFYYRTRKYAWGKFKPQLDQLDIEFKREIKDEMKTKAIQLFKNLKVEGSAKTVEKYIRMDEKMLLPQLEHADVKGKRVIVRVDWNVTLGKALQIVDDTRIVRTLPTIRWVLEHGARQVVLMSHLGKAEEKRSLEPVVKYASDLIGQPIKLVKQLSSLAVGEDRLVMMENLRLWEGEEKNDDDFARELAGLGDVYVNEAFGESHREAASIVGIPKYLPSYVGLWFEDEVETIANLQASPDHPYVVVMGGAKVEDKIKLIEVLSQKADAILLGGKLANEYIQRGMEVSGKAIILTPIEGSDLLDIGEGTQELYEREIAKAKTIVWNGPMGKVEEEQYRRGTHAIYEAICANEGAYKIVGGGDTLSAI